MYEAPKNLWIEWMTEISEILRWTNVNTFVRQLTCLEVKTRTKPWWLLRNHWHQKVHTVGEFSKDAPAYLSVWISKFPRRSSSCSSCLRLPEIQEKWKTKKEVVPFSPWRLPVVQTHPDSFPTSYDQRLPGAHQRYTSHRQRVVWNNAVDAAGSVPPSSLGLHRISSPMFKLLPSNLKTALQDVERFKPNRVTCWRGSDGCCHALCHSAHACCRQRCPNRDSWWLSRDAKRHWHFQDDVNQSLYGQSQVACLIQSGINTLAVWNMYVQAWGPRKHQVHSSASFDLSTDKPTWFIVLNGAHSLFWDQPKNHSFKPPMMRGSRTRSCSKTSGFSTWVPSGHQTRLGKSSRSVKW